ncbi:hypothetical protein EYF80_063381 [Liparis tanakae]|uniref:Uncharacterized protein n=1 Tax=Liparis tanakae TaxID=230148 RepID=A0A4Z2ECN3_9TELE|nr:hypothetical protein EYF80_063381 [Liparis tanakae]
MMRMKMKMKMKMQMQMQMQMKMRLTATTTVSSPLNLGMYLSARLRSDSLSGLKRHITFTPHSAASPIAPGTASSRQATGRNNREEQPGGTGNNRETMCGRRDKCSFAGQKTDRESPVQTERRVFTGCSSGC